MFKGLRSIRLTLQKSDDVFGDEQVLNLRLWSSAAPGVQTQPARPVPPSGAGAALDNAIEAPGLTRSKYEELIRGDDWSEPSAQAESMHKFTPHALPARFAAHNSCQHENDGTQGKVS